MSVRLMMHCNCAEITLPVTEISLQL